MKSPRALAEELERDPQLPAGSQERFSGFGVMGLPFASGHVLAFRRMPASSLGLAYTTIWHRTPSGRWTFFTDSDPIRSCPRFFGEALDEVVVGEIELTWKGPVALSLRVPHARFQWGVRLTRDARTRGMSLLGRLIPGPLWGSGRFLSTLGAVGGRFLDLGNLALSGSAPNGQRFQAAPKLLWRVEATAAILDAEDLGPIAPLSEQAKLGDFWIPNRGIFAVGEVRFDEFDPRVHSSSITGRSAEAAVAGGSEP